MIAATAGTSRAGAALSWGAWGVILTISLARAMIAFEPFPYWQMDPTVIFVPMTGLGPTGSLLLDAALLAAAGAGLLGQALRGRRISVCMCTLALGGMAAAAAHALGLFAGGSVSLDNLRVGGFWSASIAAGVAAWHLARDGRMGQAAGALLVGFVAMLAVKGAVQVFVEHPATVADFEANRAAVLASHGWPEGSPMALGFERRLRQAEATGWFGLANVYASFAAAACVALTGLAVAGFRESRCEGQRVDDGIAGIAAVGALVALGCVVLAGSKAGYGVTALGLSALGLAWLGAGRAPRRLARLASPWRVLVARRGAFAGGVVALAIVALPLGAVVAQGALGENRGDLSLLFRWFYFVGAARVIAGDPLAGVGPAGFQDAYQLLKPALSPETVESPHSVFLDFCAGLGVLGLAWAGLLLWWVWNAGASLLSRTSPSAASPEPGTGSGVLRPLLWVVLLSTLAGAWLPTLVSGAIEGGGAVRLFRMAAATPDWAVVWIIGGASWLALAYAAARIIGAITDWRPLIAPAGIALLAHAQIEMTPVQPGSAALFAVILGVAASRTGHGPAPRRGPGVALSAMFCVLAAGLATSLLPRAWRWEASLAAAALEIAPVSEIRARWERLERDPRAAAAEGDSFDLLEQDLRKLTSLYPWFEPRDFPTDYHRLFWVRLAAIDHDLRERAAAAFPSHFPTQRAASRILLQRAATRDRHPDGDDGPALAARAEGVALAATTARPGKASAWSWLASVRTARAGIAEDPGHLAGAAEALERAAALDPWGLTTAVQLAGLYERIGRGEDAARWARRALEIDESLRLDPLLRLGESDRARLLGLGG